MIIEPLTATTQSTTSPDLTANVGVLLYDTSFEVDDILASAVDLIRNKRAKRAGAWGKRRRVF